jgi:hypothetical protein
MCYAQKKPARGRAELEAMMRNLLRWAFEHDYCVPVSVTMTVTIIFCELLVPAIRCIF